MTQCPNCGTLIDPMSAVCVGCGAPVSAPVAATPSRPIWESLPPVDDLPEDDFYDMPSPVSSPRNTIDQYLPPPTDDSVVPEDILPYIPPKKMPVPSDAPKGAPPEIDVAEINPSIISRNTVSSPVPTEAPDAFRATGSDAFLLGYAGAVTNPDALTEPAPVKTDGFSSRPVPPIVSGAVPQQDLTQNNLEFPPEAALPQESLPPSFAATGAEPLPSATAPLWASVQEDLSDIPEDLLFADIEERAKQANAESAPPSGSFGTSSPVHPKTLPPDNFWPDDPF